jgi:ketosteroid isomerase-like protein
MKTVSTTEANVALVQNMYAAFLRGDMATLLGSMAPDIDWEAHGPQKDFPLFGPRKGIAEVEQFFRDVPTINEFSEFSPGEFVASGDKVVALGHYAITIRPTGRKVATDWAMVWTIRDGKVVKFREHTDSAKFVEAYRQ